MITVFLKMRDILMNKYNVAVELVMENTVQVEASSSKAADKIVQTQVDGAFFRSSLMDWDITKVYINVEEGEN